MIHWVKIVLQFEETLQCDKCDKKLSDELVYLIQEEGEKAEVLCEKCWSVMGD